MLKTLLKHEILYIIKSRRVYWTVFIFLLLFASVFIVRVIDYQEQLNQYIADVKVADESLQKPINYSHINPRAIQQPIIFSIYNEGLKIPRVVSIRYYDPIVDSESINEEVNHYYNENTKLDITFLITFFLSLFILLISYDSVSGEKQVGTLRILMTYPLKRQSFILKKILGIFIFIAFTFTIPYLLSLISLVIIFADLLALNFFLSAFFYWFLVLLFIFFFTLLGIFISTCTTNPNRSLVYSLLVWILFAIILPISWDYIAVPWLYDNSLAQLRRTYYDKWNQTVDIMNNNLPDDVNPYKVNHLDWNGMFYDSMVSGLTHTFEQHNRYQKYFYENCYPLSRQTEQARDDVLRKQISIDNVRNWIFFYNPIVLFENMATKITGNSREDELRFLQDSRNIRDELVNLGISEGWLLDYRFSTVFAKEYIFDTWDEMLAGYNGSREGDWFWDFRQDFTSRSDRLTFEMPHIRPYNQPRYTFGEIFTRIWQYLVLSVVSILALWLMTWKKFMTYDVR